VLLCVTASHKTAAFDLLERLSTPARDVAPLIASHHDCVQGAVVLSTCNRFEAYIDMDEPVTAAAAVGEEAALLAVEAATGVGAEELGGSYRVLTGNAVLAGGLVMICGFFQADTPIWVMVGVLIIGGISRSLQFTAVNTLTYADLGPQDMSRASSFAAMAQQLAISLGVGAAALVMNLSMTWRGAEHLERIDVFWSFMILGALACLSLFSFLRLPDNAAEHLNQREKKA